MSSHPSIEIRNDDVFVTIKVHPNSSQEKIVVSEDIIDVYINEPADKGKANRSVLKYFSKMLKISSSSIQLVQGSKSKTKKLKIQGITPQNILERIKKL